MMQKIRAYRWWYIGENACLASIVYSREWNFAVERACCAIEDVFAGHEPPSASCSCGIYSLKIPYYTSLSKVLEAFFTSGLYRQVSDSKYKALWLLVNEVCVHGYIDIWGKIIEHEWGYRSEYAQVHTLFLPRQMSDYQEKRKHLAAKYECEIIPFDQLEAKRMMAEIVDWVEPYSSIGLGEKR